MTRIVWMSRHVPTPRQRAALGAIFPNHHLIIDSRAFDSADQIIERWRMASADEMVVVAPDSVIRAIVTRGIHPLRAEMQQVRCNHPEAEVKIRGRCYRFVRFQRVHGIDYKLENVAAADAAQAKETTCS